MDKEFIDNPVIAYEKLKEENERLKEEIKSLQYSFLQYSMRDIDTAATLFAKDKADLENRLSLSKAYANNYRKALEEIRELFCVGRTFCEGYFDNDNLSRADKTIKIINEVLNG